MNARTINSKANPRIQHLKKLLDDKAYRLECGEYVIEGIRVLDTVKKPKEVFVLEGVKPPDIQCKNIYVVDERVFKTISATVHSQGIIVVAEQKLLGPEALDADSRYVLLDRLQDPGNMGSILRAACAFGMKGVILVPGSVDPFSPKVVRAAASSIEKLDIIKLEDVSALKSFCIIGADMQGESLEDLKWPGSFILAIGNEASGLSGEIKEASRTLVAIPMSGAVESLNAAMAAGILLCSAYTSR